MNENPQNLIAAVRYFSDLKICNAYMLKIKWPDGQPFCHHCGGTRIGEIATRGMLRCKDCRKQFSYKVGTIFEDSPLGLDKWFVAVWSIANCKNGISSHELARALGDVSCSGNQVCINRSQSVLKPLDSCFCCATIMHQTCTR
jgi:transposase-like protein